MESKDTGFQITGKYCVLLEDFNNFVYFKPFELLKINSLIHADGISSPSNSSLLEEIKW